MLQEPRVLKRALGNVEKRQDITYEGYISRSRHVKLVAFTPARNIGFSSERPSVELRGCGTWNNSRNTGEWRSSSDLCTLYCIFSTCGSSVNDACSRGFWCVEYLEDHISVLEEELWMFLNVCCSRVVRGMHIYRGVVRWLIIAAICVFPAAMLLNDGIPTSGC